jgi:hypothetical protein
MKNKKYNIVRTFQKCNRKIVERVKIDTSNTCAQIHDSSHSLLGTGTSLNSGGDTMQAKSEHVNKESF